MQLSAFQMVLMRRTCWSLELLRKLSVLSTVLLEMLTITLPLGTTLLSQPTRTRPSSVFFPNPNLV